MSNETPFTLRGRMWTMFAASTIYKQIPHKNGHQNSTPKYKNHATLTHSQGKEY